MKGALSAIWIVLLVALVGLAGCATNLGGAAMRGDTREMNRIIDEGADLNEVDGTGGTALHRAAEAGKANTVKLLAERGANLNVKNQGYFNWTPLHIAVRLGYIDTVRVLVEKGADVNSKDTRNWTPLHIASWYNHVEIVRLLVGAGADLMAQANRWFPSSGGTPLQVAQESGRKEVAEILIKAETSPQRPVFPAPRPPAAVSQRAPIVPPAQPAQRPKDLPKVAVWDLTPREVKTAYAQELTSILVSELTQLNRYEVYSQENVRTLAGWTEERMKLGCTSTQCLIALGQMDITKLIFGSVGKIGDTYTISLNLFDTQNARSENAVSDFCRSDNELISLIQRAVAKLLRGGY